MNVSVHCPGSLKTAASTRDWMHASSDASQRDFAISAPAATQPTRLIDAACKAFLVNRGLDPDVDCGQQAIPFAQKTRREEADNSAIAAD
jgi:hypothetical protein